MTTRAAWRVGRWALVFAVLAVNLAIQLPLGRTPIALSLVPAASAMSKQPRAYVVRVYGFPCYRTVEETYASLAGLASNHPTLASWLDVGDSWQKVPSATFVDIIGPLTNHS